MANVRPQDLTHEEEIVWLEDLDPLDYVRERLDEYCAARKRRPRYDGPGRLVGYAKLSQDTKSWSPGYFRRRIFWLADHDRNVAGESSVYSKGPGAPMEAVDPRTVRPGVPGQQTERAWGGPLHA